MGVRYKIFLFILTFSLSSFVFAEEPGKKLFGLTEGQIERAKASQYILREVDARTLPALIKDLKKSGRSEANLELYEAIAKAYADIEKEQKVEKLGSKKYLYSMIQLNLAFLQLGGKEQNLGASRDRALNRLILRKLKENIPPDLLDDPQIFRNVDEWSK